MKNILFTITATSLVFISIALYGFVSGQVELSPHDPYAQIASAKKGG